MRFFYPSNIVSVFILLFVLSPLALLAQEQLPKPIETDRPSISQSTHVIPHKTVQLEAGVLYLSDVEDGADRSLIAYPEALLRIGVLKCAELRINGASRIDTTTRHDGIKDNQSGYGPIAIGTKIKLLEQKGIRPTVSMMAGVKLESGSGPFKTEKLAPRADLLFSNELSEMFTLTYNVGYFWSSDGTNGTGAYAVELEAEVSPKVKLYAELYGATSDGEPFRQSADAGVMVQVLNNLQLDIAGAHRLNKHAPDYWLTAGVGVRLPR